MSHSTVGTLWCWPSWICRTDPFVEVRQETSSKGTMVLLRSLTGGESSEVHTVGQEDKVTDGDVAGPGHHEEHGLRDVDRL